MSKIKVVVDTNIFLNSWFSNYDSCDKVLAMLENNKLRLCFSQDMIGELMYMSKKYAIKNMSSNIKRLALLNKVSELFLNSMSINTRNTKCPEIKDKYDEMFVKCAIEGNVKYLVTNDFKSGMHKLEQYEFKVLDAEKFVDIYNSDKEVAVMK